MKKRHFVSTITLTGLMTVAGCNSTTNKAQEQNTATTADVVQVSAENEKEQFFAVLDAEYEAKAGDCVEDRMATATCARGVGGTRGRTESTIAERVGRAKKANINEQLAGINVNDLKYTQIARLAKEMGLVAGGEGDNQGFIFDTNGKVLYEFKRNGAFGALDPKEAQGVINFLASYDGSAKMAVERALIDAGVDSRAIDAEGIGIRILEDVSGIKTIVIVDNKEGELGSFDPSDLKSVQAALNALDEAELLRRREND